MEVKPNVEPVSQRSLFNFERKNLDAASSQEDAPRQYARTFIKFSHEEVEALLNMLNEIDANSPLSEVEKTAKDKLKRIYARQILSHEKWENEK